MIALSPSGTPTDPVLIRILIAAIGPVVTVLLAWLVGHKLSAMWAERQKSRELAILAANEFYRIYGEFFAVWKLWNSLRKRGIARKSGLGDDRNRLQLLERATRAEGSMEALLVKLSTERRLSVHDIRNIGEFRQLFQLLRPAIRRGVSIGWNKSDHPQYVAFKERACAMASIIASADRFSLPDPKTAGVALLAMTSNRWEEFVAKLIRR